MISTLGEKSALLIPRSWQSGMQCSGEISVISESQKDEMCQNLTKPVVSPEKISFESVATQMTDIVSS